MYNVASHHGGPVAIPGRSDQHVVMTMDMYRMICGVGSISSFNVSVAALRKALAEAEAGDFVDEDDAFSKIERKYGV